MNKWLITILFGFSAGVLICSFYDFDWSFSAMFIFLGLLLASLFYILKFQKFVLFTGLFFLALGLGILRYGIKDVRETAFEGQIGSKITVSGTIIEEPDEKENYTRLILEIEEVPPQGRDTRISNQIEDLKKFGTKILVTSRRYPILRYGDRIEVNGILRKPEKISDFDWPAYLAKDDIYFEMIYPQTKLLQGTGGSWLQRQLFSMKEKFIDNISKIIPEPDAGYLAGLTIGGKKAMSKDLQEEFKRAGVIHIVVLSGYNVTIVASVIMQILKGLPFFVGIGFGILGILFFTLMTGASATVVRASLMASLALLARATGRVYQITIALFAAGFLMILNNPKILRFDSSFQLSFLSTLALIFVSPHIEKRLSFVPKKFQLREILGSTISTQIFVLPFLLYKMGMFSVVSMPVNLLVLFFVPITMFFGFITGGLGFISRFLAAPFGWIAYAFSAYELWIVNLFSKLPFAAFNISIPLWLTLFIYIGYAILLFKLSRNKKYALDKK